MFGFIVPFFSEAFLCYHDEIMTAQVDLEIQSIFVLDIFDLRKRAMSHRQRSKDRQESWHFEEKEASLRPPKGTTEEQSLF